MRCRATRARFLAACIGSATIVTGGFPTWVQASEPVLVRMHNFRFCGQAVTECFAEHQAYLADPTTGEPVGGTYNPAALIDVHAGDEVAFRYDDGPAGPERPLTCDSFNGGPIGIDLGINQLRCPGHAVVLAAAGPGGAQEHLGFVAREQLGASITWAVPDGVGAGTIIPFFCDVGNGLHYRVGMTGALRVVG